MAEVWPKSVKKIITFRISVKMFWSERPRDIGSGAKCCHLLTCYVTSCMLEMLPFTHMVCYVMYAGNVAIYSHGMLRHVCWICQSSPVPPESWWFLPGYLQTNKQKPVSKPRGLFSSKKACELQLLVNEETVANILGFFPLEELHKHVKAGPKSS